jgi:hypothetical protein
MKLDVELIKEAKLTGALERYHAMERNDDPALQMQGRLGKLLITQLSTFLTTEEARESNPALVYLAMQSVCLTMMGSTFVTVFSPEVRTECGPMIIDRLKEQIEGVFTQLAHVGARKYDA